VAGAETLAELIERIPDEVPAILKMNISDPGRFADLAATNLNFKVSDKDEILQRLNIGQRLKFLLGRVEREVDARGWLKTSSDRPRSRSSSTSASSICASSCARSSPSSEKVIRGKGSDRDAKKARRSKSAREGGTGGRREIERMRNCHPPRASISDSTYLDWMLALPWNVKSSKDEVIELKKVEELLDSRHYGLKEARSGSPNTWRCESFVAAIRTVLSFASSGRPEPARHRWAKRSRCRSPSPFTGYRWWVRDEAEVRGHRRTYVARCRR